MAADGIEVAEFLRKHLKKDKVILLGHSWGSILGIHMAKARPDLFYAYVGTGQVADMNASQKLSYAYVLDKARAAKDEKAVAKLQGIGPPPFDTMDKIVTFFTTLPDYESASDQKAIASLGSALTAPDFSLRDVVNLVRGFMTVPTFAVYREMLSADLRSQATGFDIPIFFFQGSEDARTQLSVAREYFDVIHAPRKEFVVLEGGGHFAVWTMRDQVLRELLARVRPLLLAATPEPQRAVRGHAMDILVRRQQRELMPDRELGQQRIDRGDLNATSPATVAKLGRVDMVLAIRHQER
jgi:pimeloyl-ACP methyl ester carboxylesterase